MSKLSCDPNDHEYTEDKEQNLSDFFAIELLPTELILKIFAKLDSIEDVRNCMLVNKNFYNLIINSPNYWKNIIIFFRYGVDYEALLAFLRQNGSSVKNIQITTNYEFNLSHILKLVPNLEDLQLREQKYPENLELIDNPFSLPYLKVLNIDGEVDTFIKNVRDVNNLEVLITTEYNIYRKFIKKRLVKFLKQVLPNLKVLKFIGKYEIKIVNLIHEKGEKLEKLELCSKIVDDEFFGDTSTELTFPLVKFFGTDTNTTPVKFQKILEIFPNVVSLRFHRLVDINATLPQIKALCVSFLDCDRLLDLKLPNLKMLTVYKMFGDKIEDFSKNVPKLEVFALEEGFDRFDFKKLKNFKNLKYIECYSGRKCLLRIRVDLSKNIFYFDKNNQKSLKIYNEHFSTFKFVENKYLRLCELGESCYDE